MSDPSSITGTVLTTPKDGSVTTAKLVDGSVTAGKLGSASVTSEKLSADAITGMTAETAIADADEIIFNDSSASALRRIRLNSYFPGCGFSAYSTSNQTIVTNTWTPVNFGTESSVYFGDWAASGSVNYYDGTNFAPTSTSHKGLYFISAAFQIGAFTTHAHFSYIDIGFDSGGGTFSNSTEFRTFWYNVGGNITCQVTGLIYLDGVNDRVCIMAFHNLGSNATISAATGGGPGHFLGWRIKQ